MIPINKYLSYILLKTFFISFFLFVISNSVLISGESRVFEEKQADFIESIAIAFWLFALSLSSLSIYLNNFKFIRYKVFYRLLSFFLSPLILSLSIWIFGSKSREWFSFFLSTGLFFLILIYFYCRLTILYCKIPG